MLILSALKTSQYLNYTVIYNNPNITIKNIGGEEFKEKYGFKCPVGVRGRNSDNNLYFEKIGWKVNQPLYDGIEKTYLWINNLVNN